MAQTSVSQEERTISARQVRRHWKEQFRQRMQEIPLTDWRCVGVDIGKYEHVAVVTDGFGKLLDNPWRFGIRRCDTEDFFERIDRQCGEGEQQPVIGMEPTGHYYEQLACGDPCKSVSQKEFLQNCQAGR